MSKNKILNIDIASIHLDDLLAKLKKGVLFTPNVDHVIKLQKDEEFYKAYNHADWVICDSKILNMAAKFIGTGFKEVIPGSSFLPAFYNYHKNNKDVKIFLLGAAEGVAEKAMNNINEKVGANMVVGAYSPTFTFEHNEQECQDIVDRIYNSGANILVVGLGAPKQEKWIVKYKDQLKNIDLFMALGATIDFEAGNIKRAPMLYQKLHMEWAYRLLKEPKRLWKRYLIDDVPFLFYIIQQKFGVYKNPF
ncbi:WecB/TagA/CpsF family glycosyltransferase [Mucilaginibacter lappiensis]|uniref:WecB/TagA/CpsF family glycosyltransferase n=1 Tax=Mucilaginibacter lappiensis TaxID=354630 RepID=UPI003D21AE0B